MEEEIKVGDIYCFNFKSDNHHTYGKNYVVVRHINPTSIQITCDEENYPYQLALSILDIYFYKVDKSPVLLIEELFNSI